MDVRLADHFGMCFGVKDALALALDVARREPVTILGDLVHNDDVVAELEAAGAVRARRPEDVHTRSVVLTAHGTPQRIQLQLRTEGLVTHNAVCPLVTRVHTAVAKLLAENRHPVIVGQAGHVEVRGIVDDLSESSVVLQEADLDQLAGRPRLGVVAQTTQPIDHVHRLVAAMRRRFPRADIRFIDTVCQPTKDRQQAMARLAAECSVIVVVGGPESNNSRKLTEMAIKRGCRAYQVANASELREEWFEGLETVGLTAGTSTPDRIIAEVRERLESMPAAAKSFPRRASSRDETHDTVSAHLASAGQRFYNGTAEAG
jgi:4-hydroxy-3-methylbut-2-enyl diphosphate reductase